LLDMLVSPAACRGRCCLVHPRDSLSKSAWSTQERTDRDEPDEPPDFI
jgi:hypothetical protein